MFSIATRLRDFLAFASKRQKLAPGEVVYDGRRSRVHRTLSGRAGQQLRAWILKTVPREKCVLVMAIRGNSESCGFALEIHEFLRANGFKMQEPESIWQAEPNPTPKGVRLRSESDALCVVVVGTIE